MSERLTTLMHDAAGRVHPRLQAPEALRRQAERRRRARVGAAALAVVVVVAVTVLAATLRTVQPTYWMPAQQPEWVPAWGNSAVGDWEIIAGPTVLGAGAVTTGCEPEGTKCPGFTIEVVAINRSEVPQEANSLVATGGYTDGSGEVWRAECERSNSPNSARASQYVMPGQEVRVNCDNEGKPLESMDNVDFASVNVIQN